MPPFPPVILIDLDDTILRFSAVTEESWQYACATCASQLDGITLDTLITSIKKHAQWYWSDAERGRQGRLDLVTARRLIVRAALADFRDRIDQVADAIADTYGAQRDELVRPFPGAIETLGELRRWGIRLALVTNGAGRDQRRKIARFQLEPFFDEIFVEGELGYGKPDLRVFRLALARLGVTPGDAWMIGNDLEMDIAPATTLGIVSIWVDHAEEGLPSESLVQPTRRVAALAEIL
jgi:putative hydrolase of the HAD superfamily